MTSEKQLNANRANATKSTGPRSQAGKARSRLNSRKHGLTAKMLIIVDENVDDFDQLRAELIDEHDPKSVLECELVERLAGILWRLRRVPFFEAAIIDARHDQVSRDKYVNEKFNSAKYNLGVSFEPEQQNGRDEKDEEAVDREAAVHFGRALINDAVRSDALGKLGRHEATLMNAFTKTLQMLLLLQENRENRKSEPVVLESVALPPAA
jgi:hypothetical protein